MGCACVFASGCCDDAAGFRMGSGLRIEFRGPRGAVARPLVNELERARPGAWRARAGNIRSLANMMKPTGRKLS